MLVEVVHVHRDPCLILASFQQPDLDKFPPTVSEGLRSLTPNGTMSNAHIQTAMPVPDLDVMANLLQGVTDQVRYCQRLPTFDSGAVILQAINQLQDSVARMDDKIDNNHRSLTDKIAQVDRKIDNVRDTLSIEIEAVGRRVMIS